MTRKRNRGAKSGSRPQPQPAVKTKSAELAGSKGSTTAQPFAQGNVLIKSNYYRFGSDNLFPQAIAFLNRNAGVHRGILNSKVRYLTGKGFSTENVELQKFIDAPNEEGSLQKLAGKFFLDRVGAGNGWLEVIRVGDEIKIYHHDHTTCRIGKGEYSGYILIHPDWENYSSKTDELRKIRRYPEFEADPDAGDGMPAVERSMYHDFDYEPEFTKYGIPRWYAGIRAARIAYKTNAWNESRLDNGYRLSAAIIVDGQFASEEDEEQFDKDMDDTFSGEGNQGKAIKIKKNTEGDNSKVIEFPHDTEGDWPGLTKASAEELLVLHEWHATLAGMSTSTGFDTSRILNEWNVAMNGVVAEEQERFVDIIQKILGDQTNIKADDLAFINKPPLIDKPNYMYVWEARKADGLDFDPDDPSQQLMLVQLEKQNTKSDQSNGQ